MLCERVLPLLSEYFDGVLDSDTAVFVSQHLNQCHSCRKEFDGLAEVHSKLRSLRRVRAPAFLHDLVQLRLADMHKNRWQTQLRNTLERRWSIIRSTEGMWYISRALGTIMTCLFLILISSAINPIDLRSAASTQDLDVRTTANRQQVVQDFQAKFGKIPGQIPKGRIELSKPAIHDQTLSNFGQSISQNGKDYDFSVVTYVDPNGQANVENVLEHPNAQSFLQRFNKVISSGRFAPARKNGEAIPSYVLLMFSKISVND